jgi:hypothetical protein
VEKPQGNLEMIGRGMDKDQKNDVALDSKDSIGK